MKSLPPRPAGLSSAKYCARTRIHRFRRIAIQNAILDLTLIAVHLLTGNAAKENARVQSDSMRHAFELHDNVAKLAFRFQHARSASYAQKAFGSRREFARHVREAFPPLEVFSRKHGVKTERFELNVAKLHSSLVVLKSDETTPRGRGIRIAHDHFAVQLNRDLAALHRYLILMPLFVGRLTGHLLSLH